MRPAEQLTPFGVRPATLADVPAMARNVADGFASYRAWASPGFTPPTAAVEEERIAQRMVMPGWAAHCTDDVTTHVASLDADDEPGTTHLLQLFVRPERQGTGVAATLLSLALADARAYGSHTMRLLTPAGNARGLAFYAREGFAVVGEPFWIDGLGLEIVRLQRAL